MPGGRPEPPLGHTSVSTTPGASRPLVTVGEFSYSLYLLHMPVLFIGAPRLAAPVGWAGGLGLLAAVTAVSCVFAWGAWRWIERPSNVAGNRVCVWFSRRLGTRALPSAVGSR